MEISEDFKFFQANSKKDETDVMQFLIQNFTDHPLFMLAPVPDEELEHFWTRLVHVNLTIIARLGKQMAGCYTGQVTKWKNIKKVRKWKETEKSLKKTKKIITKNVPENVPKLIFSQKKCFKKCLRKLT